MEKLNATNIKTGNQNNWESNFLTGNEAMQMPGWPTEFTLSRDGDLCES